LTVVDASIVVRRLQNRVGDEGLQERLNRDNFVHAPALIDAEVAAAIRGLMLTTKAAVRVSAERAEDMLSAFADFRLVRHPMLPYQRRVLALRRNLTAYDASYVALAESLGTPLLTGDGTFARAAGHAAVIESYP
jgi:predicted nucleic acid-binding protein